VRISDLAITLAMAASFLVAAPAAHGQLNRTAASVAGNDANNCSLVAPCRTIGHAVSQTNPGGEVVVLDSPATDLLRSIGRSPCRLLRAYTQV